MQNNIMLQPVQSNPVERQQVFPLKQQIVQLVSQGQPHSTALGQQQTVYNRNTSPVNQGSTALPIRFNYSG